VLDRKKRPVEVQIAPSEVEQFLLPEARIKSRLDDGPKGVAAAGWPAYCPAFDNCSAKRMLAGDSFGHLTDDHV